MCGDLEDTVDLARGYRRARKPHTCCACRETVPVGHRYHFTTTVYDGRIRAFKHCARCWFVIEALWRSGVEAVEFELDCGEIWEDPPDDIAELAFLSPAEAQAQIVMEGQ